jgi:hypothetical protein
MKNVLLFSLIILSSTVLFAQKNSKYTNYYYDFDFGEQFGVSLLAKNVVSKSEYVKLGLEINNQTTDYLYFVEDKCKFVINNNSYYPKKVKKGKIIPPQKKISVTVNASEQTDYLVDWFDFKPGGIFKFSSEGKSTEFEPFHLPPDRNEIVSDKFSLKMLKLKKETKETAVKFEVTYTGDKIAIIDPSNCVIRTEKGKEWANAFTKTKPIVLQKNESDKFTVLFTIPGKITDMQFAEMDIVWKNTFRESDLEELHFDIQGAELDKKTTYEKN